MQHIPSNVAELVGPLHAGVRDRPLDLSTLDLEPLGYREREFMVRGTARRYRVASHQTSAVEVDGTSPYATRLLVRTPADPRRFSGSVIVEWFNVAMASDAGLAWVYSHTELVRAGHAWVGVSADRSGVVAVDGTTRRALTVWDPVRYASLRHPGDCHGYDIFGQAAACVRDEATALFGGPAEVLLATGVSEAAYRLTTYINDIDHIDQIFDGFLVQARPATTAPLTDDAHNGTPTLPTTLRTDLRVPVLVVQTESELTTLGYRRARQPDTALLRVWEVAGAAHVDTYLTFGANSDDGHCSPQRLAVVFTPAGPRRRGRVNCAPQRHYVACAAVAGLDKWVRTSAPPEAADPLRLHPADPDTFATDGLGISVGGLRTPWVDVPLAVTSGAGAPGQIPAGFLGTARPLPAETLAALYRDEDDFLARFAASARTCCERGHLLPADLPEIVAVAAEAYRLTTR